MIKVASLKIIVRLGSYVGIFYYLIIFQYHYVGKYRNNNYISYLSIVSLNWLVIKLSDNVIRFLIG